MQETAWSYARRDVQGALVLASCQQTAADPTGAQLCCSPALSRNASGAHHEPTARSPHCHLRSHHAVELLKLPAVGRCGAVVPLRVHHPLQHAGHAPVGSAVVGSHAAAAHQAGCRGSGVVQVEQSAGQVQILSAACIAVRLAPADCWVVMGGHIAAGINDKFVQQVLSTA